ncbi:hypothetical protein FFLO_04633 [Filobasidium floriforme]|uniref:Uncharacterized protein n=1 Tax=Filobasidium floriforme TaxID=5210 RepID=A0A8K0NM65_9TREE|nr:uncharacterized protein HD553DRAFT_344517 [Filobasidium floriforme]KAG7531022.1 hypothetical protein FFLO_04633 [Filobasidium floriforme]KAH8080750.1 hypothetical protein HD553DRAFT_344517 [Filobasidium floriforme]
MSTDTQAMPQGKEPQSRPVLKLLEFEEIKFQRKTDWRGEIDKDTWPKLTEKMNSIIQDEIAELREILEGVNGAEFREDFGKKARQVLSNKESESRRNALRKKAEQGLPSKYHHTVKVLFATTVLDSSPIEVKIALEITVTEGSTPKAPQSAAGHSGTIVWFFGLQKYTVNLPEADYQFMNADNDSDDSLSDMGDTSEPEGSHSNNLDPSGRPSYTGYTGYSMNPSFQGASNAYSMWG